MTQYAISQVGTTVAEVTVKDGVVTPVRAILWFDLEMLDVSRIFGSVEAAARAALRAIEQSETRFNFTVTRLALEHLAEEHTRDRPVVRYGQRGAGLRR